MESKCELCSNIKDYKDLVHGSQWEDIFYNSEENKYILVLEQFRYEYSTLNIKYCPSCGRLLE